MARALNPVGVGRRIGRRLTGRTAGRLAVDRNGRVFGAASITYNQPFPTVNGQWGGDQRQGVVMHTMAGNLPGTIALFNDPAAAVSAHFGIDQAGNIHQFGPVGRGWVAWHAEAANFTWYGIEHADNGDPDIPLTDAQLTASAQLYECLSRIGGFPLQEANQTWQTGYGVHYMGGLSWGGHTCPDLPPEHVRSRQRPVILARAAAIRAGQPLPRGAGPAAGYGASGQAVSIPAGAVLLRLGLVVLLGGGLVAAVVVAGAAVTGAATGRIMRPGRTKAEF